jgi:hypothetical protein
VNVRSYPTLQRIPGYPVYYAPEVNSNMFFYDGLYWVFDGDQWYASSWYNGPWGRVDQFDVPDYVLRVPVSYYRRAPVYFRSWRADAPPRWDERWGRTWVERRRDWDRWDRRSSPSPAPLPAYQRDYRGDRYPSASQQGELRSRNYRYQPNEPVARQHYEERRPQRGEERRSQGIERRNPSGNETNVRPGETVQQRNERLGAGG